VDGSNQLLTDSQPKSGWLDLRVCGTQTATLCFQINRVNSHSGNGQDKNTTSVTMVVINSIFFCSGTLALMH